MNSEIRAIDEEEIALRRGASEISSLDIDQAILVISCMPKSVSRAMAYEEIASISVISATLRLAYAQAVFPRPCETNYFIRGRDAAAIA
jgi:hypothetical protein